MRVTYINHCRWSVGCIFAELLTMKAVNNQRDPLFPGGSCMPWSPGHAARGAGGLDQLDVICDVIGTPSRNTLQKMGLSASDIHKRLAHPRPAIDLQRRFPEATRDSLDLLKHMLAFDPADRISITDALHHPYLMTGHQGRISPSSQSGVDPEAGVDIDFSFEEKSVSIRAIRAMILDECAWYRGVWKQALRAEQQGAGLPR